MTIKIKAPRAWADGYGYTCQRKHSDYDKPVRIVRESDYRKLLKLVRAVESQELNYVLPAGIYAALDALKGAK